MKERFQKIFLPIVLGIVLSLAAFFAVSDVHAAGPGSIKVCKIVVDQGNYVVTGQDKPGTTFTISGINPSPNSQEVPVGQIETSVFTTPLTLNTDIFPSVPGNDARCVTYSNLDLGAYFYSTETINPSSGWDAPVYNDQYITPVVTLSDFYVYDNNIFDGDPTNDASRNTNADGHIILDNARMHRTVVILNKYRVQGGNGGSSSTNTTNSICSTQNKPQKVDQIWFSNIKPSQATVHWANKGDAQGYHIAYGVTPNNWLWGVKVGNVNEVTLQNLPTNTDIYVTIIPLGKDDCPGDPSQAVKIGDDSAVGGAIAFNKTGILPNILAATGGLKNILLFASGIALTTVGIWQAKSKHKSAKAAK